MPTEALKWRQARQWLINSEVIPPAHRVTKPDVDLVDFARSLRDGVFLCSLVNKLKPNCVEDWSPKPLTQVRGERREREQKRNVQCACCGSIFHTSHIILFAYHIYTDCSLVSSRYGPPCTVGRQ